MKKFLLLILTIALALSMCACTVFGRVEATSDRIWISSFQMECIGSSDDAGGKILLFRDAVTDVLYIREVNGGGLTVMLDPETGLPMTYTNYAARIEQMQPTKNTN